MRDVYPVITVRDVLATLRFYTEVLGFEEWFRWGDDPARPLSAGLMHGQARLICDAAPAGGLPARAGEGVELYFDVGEMDIDGYYARVAGRGARIVEPPTDKPWGDRVFRVEDPDGYVLAFARTLTSSGGEPPEGGNPGEEGAGS
ncbi:MAG TPA: VOC family protein [Limnochordales bacterium]